MNQKSRALSVSRLPIGAGICMFAMVANTGMDTLIKFASETGSTWQLVFLRWMFGFILLAPLMAIRGSKTDWKFFRCVHLSRMLLNLIGSVALFYALAHLPLAVVVTIFFTEPLITVVFARIILGEVISSVRWTCTILAFLAVFMVSAPAVGTSLWSWIDVNALVAFCGAAAWGLMRVLTKRDRESVSTMSLMFWMAATTMAASAPIAALDWRPIDALSILIIFGVAALGNLYNYLWLHALRLLPASYIANFFYILLPLSFLSGYIFFGDVPGWNAYAGCLIVIILVFISSNQSAEVFVLRAIRGVFHRTR